MRSRSPLIPMFPRPPSGPLLSFGPCPFFPNRYPRRPERLAEVGEGSGPEVGPPRERHEPESLADVIEGQLFRLVKIGGGVGGGLVRY